MNNAKLFVTTYAIYNNGDQFKSSQHGFYFYVDLQDYEELLEHFTELKLDEDPELMFTDFEGFPKDLYNESMTELEFDRIKEYLELEESEKVGFEYLIFQGNDVQYSLDNATEIIISEESLEDYAYDFVQDCYDLPEFAQTYFDYDKFGRDLELGGDVYQFTDSQGNDYLITNANEY